MNTIPRHWIEAIIEKNQRILRFDHFMGLALYHPEYGYYSQGERIFGATGDFITAPEISPLFGQTLAQSIAEVLDYCGGHLWEFGAGQGKLAAQLIKTLGLKLKKYHIVELSGRLKTRQAEELQAHGVDIQTMVTWETQLPETLTGVVLGNEVLDAMPVRLFRKAGQQFYERHVKLNQNISEGLTPQTLCFEDIPTSTELQQAITTLHAQHGPWPENYVSEWHEQACGFIKTITEKLHGIAIFIDYGFGASEFYHPQRNTGTLVAHQRHQMHSNVLAHIGQQDLTAHVNFSAIYEAMHQAGGELLGYTSQAAFLLAHGILDFSKSQHYNNLEMIKTNQNLNTLLSPAEMGELFKVMVFSRNVNPDPWAISKILTSIDRSRQL